MFAFFADTDSDNDNTSKLSFDKARDKKRQRGKQRE